MNVIETLLYHRSIREYKPDPVCNELLYEILNAGCRASTTGNMQLYSIIITSSDEGKAALAPAHFNQPSIASAPVVLTFCADFNRFNKWCRARDAEPGFNNFLSFFTAAIDALLVAQNVCVAAESKGLGICYFGTTTYNADKIVEALKLPNGVVPVTTITLGYIAKDPGITDRLPLEAVIHRERYNDYTSDDINRIYKIKESLPVYKGYVKDNNKTSLAQVFTEVRYKKADNEHFSGVLLNVLKNQGFL